MFRLAVDDGGIDISRGPASVPDVIIETDPGTLEELTFAGLTVTTAERAGRLRFDGDRRTLERLLSLFAVSNATPPRQSTAG